ncbi:MAG: T9SS type A sorting domain-containing protein [Bacteroidetes bacterium]|nr:MAG: T9SS type A sorting domain-containing protein [Bacteroidota bacterium]
MKKLYTLIAAVAISGTAMAQEAYLYRTYESAPAVPTATETITDTLIAPPQCANPDLALYGATTGGYLSGTNGYGDKEKGMLIFPSQAYKIENVYALIAAKEHVVSGNIHAYIYPVDTAAGTIGAVAGTSAPVAVTSIDTANLGWTAFNFTNGPVVSGAFIMTIQVDNGGDTIGIVTSSVAAACGGGQMFDKLADDSWANTATRWGGADVWLWMMADVDNNISTEENILDRQSARAFPNPANDNINFTYHINGNREVIISVMDIQGRVIMTQTENQVEGRQFVEMNTSALSAGTYFYSVQSGSDVMSGKFVVRH